MNIIVIKSFHSEQLSIYTLGVIDLRVSTMYITVTAPPRTVRARASSAASASSSLGLGNLGLDDLLSRSSLLTSLQPRLALRRAHRVVR